MWEQSSNQYLKSWIRAKSNYSNYSNKHIVHCSSKGMSAFQCKICGPNPRGTTRSSILLSSMKGYLWILYPWFPWSEVKEWFQTFVLVSHSELHLRDLFWSILKSRVHWSLAIHHSCWRKNYFGFTQVSLALLDGHFQERSASGIYSVI